jgi:ABC-type antimicrobial peptide transport system permease subunit
MLLNLFFVALELVALGLCFFSLLASMMANIGEQKKEIGVLLALGLPPSAMVRVYTHEAFALTLSSCILGTAIGALVAWTFGQQQALFTSVPAPFTVPWGTILTVIVASGVAALLAACCPAARLTRKPITSLLR